MLAEWRIRRPLRIKPQGRFTRTRARRGARMRPRAVLKMLHILRKTAALQKI